MSDSSQHHELHHARLSCPSLSPRVSSNSCPLTWWCYPVISSSVASFSSCPQSIPASMSFPMSRLFASSWPKYWSCSFSNSPSNVYSGLISLRIDWFNLLVVQGILKNLVQHHNSKTSILQCSAFFMAQLSHLYMTTGKTIAFTIWTFVGKEMSFLFNTLSRFVRARSKHLLNPCLLSPSAVILEPKKTKSVTASTFSPSICYEVMGPDVMILVFWMLNFKSAFSLSSSPSSRGSLVPLCFQLLEWYHLHIWGCWYFFWQSCFQLVIQPAQHFTWYTLHIS